MFSKNIIDQLDEILKFAAEKEGGLALSSITNFSTIKSEISKKLQSLVDIPKRSEDPVIYHLDVGAMYPNIILTNRLQPVSIVTDETCASCEFNKPENNCQRKMNWHWKGEVSPVPRSDYNMIKMQLESERFPHATEKGKTIGFFEFPLKKQQEMLNTRLKEYSKKVFKKSKDVKDELRESTVCQRENSFYVDTVKAFRDRRYIYKSKLKTALSETMLAEKSNDPSSVSEAKKKVVLYDSLQLAHKCILNSFYGYVMRRGSR